MKRIIIIALLTMLVLSFALAAYGDDERTTEVSYTVSSTEYEITIPSTIKIDIDSEFKITLSECHSTLSISLRSSNANAATLRMKGKASGNYLNYTISDINGTNYGPYNPILVNGTGVTLYFIPDSTALNFAPNDIYEDTLTFTIG